MKRYMFIAWLMPSLAFAGPTNFTPTTAAAHLKLTAPVSVEMAGGYLDGGSIGVTLVDVNTNKFHMFEDHSLGNGLAGRKDLPEEIRKLYENRKNTGGRIYVANDMPRRGGRLTSVKEGALIKAAVICLAQHWAKRTPTLKEPKRARDNTEVWLRVKRQKRARAFILRQWKAKEPTKH